MVNYGPCCTSWLTSSGWWFRCHFGHFPIYWVANHPNWLSYFSEGWRKTTNQSLFHSKHFGKWIWNWSTPFHPLANQHVPNLDRTPNFQTPKYSGQNEGHNPFWNTPRYDLLGYTMLYLYIPLQIIIELDYPIIGNYIVLPLYKLFGIVSYHEQHEQK